MSTDKNSEKTQATEEEKKPAERSKEEQSIISEEVKVTEAPLPRRRRRRRTTKKRVEEEEGPPDLGPQEEPKNLMRKPYLAKVVVNIGVGESGEKVARATTLLESLTGQKPVRTAAKRANRDLNIRMNDFIGCKVTLRKDSAGAFLPKALDAVDGTINRKWFDEEGNFAFGIDEHINIPGIQYDPSIGIYGMDVCVTIERKGYRIKRRKLRKKKVPRHHRVGKLEAMRFIRDSYGVRVV